MAETNIYARNPDGTFAAGNTIGRWTDPSVTRRIKQALADVATPELIQSKMLELLSDPSGHVKGQALSLLLAYTLGKPKESIEITGTGQALPSLSPEALALVIRDMQREQAPVIDVTAEPVPSDK
ncbi:MAG: hypothetical protein QM703_22865 [Gemmatales bacterium]